MPPFASGEARRLTAHGRRLRRSSIAAAALIVQAAFVACAAIDLGARAKRDDASHGTSAFTWVYEHDPARLDVWRFPVGAVGTYLRSGRARAVGGTIDAACRETTRDRALLLVVAPERSRTRERALDCGVAIERDGFAVVIAPR